MRTWKRYPANLPDPSTVAPGTVVASDGWGLWGEGQGWRQRTGRFTGPTWTAVFLETPSLRAVRRKVTDLVLLLSVGYIAGVFGWTAARAGQQMTTLDIHLIAGSVMAVFVSLLVVGWGRFSVDDPRGVPQAGAVR
ncbi:hypothetical protein KZI27_01025 (plasmid) [Curtobacterium sp. TC1]|uniref:hypothetical protein n=1 Tax=Curtobacterium sp. TC1 TaxID=2862880 RepID=UPI001C9A622B|nr:hypothetical protein [Curtobacterium sp. TC1]QZQ53758.1 hypothetical protein KZI27_01025 [Curtobacterium sp. TC1]